MINDEELQRLLKINVCTFLFLVVLYFLLIAFNFFVCIKAVID